jgi:hypothetical protein
MVLEVQTVRMVTPLDSPLFWLDNTFKSRTFFINFKRAKQNNFQNKCFI